MKNKEGATFKTTVWMISGPSSCGKSTFIKNCPYQKVGFPHANLPIFFPIKLLRGESFGDYKDVILHYNILRLYRIISETRSNKHVKRRYNKYIKKFMTLFGRSEQQYYFWEELKADWDYQKDPLFMLLNKLDTNIKVIVLIANADLIKQRMLKRKLVEERKISDNKSPYPQNYWLTVLEQVNLLDVYNIWLDFLRQNKIEYQLYNANTMDYFQLSGPENIVKVVYGKNHAV